MRSSPEDAIAFLRRWQKDKVLVSVTVEAGDLIVSAYAYISFSDDGLVLKAENPWSLPEERFVLQVPLAEIEHYEYMTPRDLTPRDPSGVPPEQDFWELFTK